MPTFAFIGVLQFHCNSDFCVGTSDERPGHWLVCKVPSALTTQSIEQPQKLTFKYLEEGKNKYPECTICPKQSLRSSSSLSVC